AKNLTILTMDYLRGTWTAYEMTTQGDKLVKKEITFKDEKKKKEKKTRDGNATHDMDDDEFFAMIAIILKVGS
ncbi:hypothetical protein KI387_007117, partial [Taxus chinensis]